MVKLGELVNDNKLAAEERFLVLQDNIRHQTLKPATIGSIDDELMMSILQSCSPGLPRWNLCVRVLVLS